MRVTPEHVSADGIRPLLGDVALGEERDDEQGAGDDAAAR